MKADRPWVIRRSTPDGQEYIQSYDGPGGSPLWTPHLYLALHFGYFQACARLRNLWRAQSMWSPAEGPSRPSVGHVSLYDSRSAPLSDLDPPYPSSGPPTSR